MKSNDIGIRAKNAMVRNGIELGVLEDENEIEKYITRFIEKNGYGFGHGIRGWGISCANWLFSKAPDKLIVISDKVYTEAGLRYIQKLKAIECGSKGIKEDKDGWILAKRLLPANEGWYIVLIEETEQVQCSDGIISTKSEHYVACEQYKNNNFSKNVIAWRHLPKIQLAYMMDLIEQNSLVGCSDE